MITANSCYARYLYRLASFFQDAAQWLEANPAEATEKEYRKIVMTAHYYRDKYQAHAQEKQ